MKVLMICTVPLAGNGIATCVNQYATGLADAGCCVHILAPKGVPEQTLAFLQEKEIAVHELPDRKQGAVKYFLALLKCLRRERYDVVHVHGNSCTVTIELLAAALSGCPLRITHSHNTSCTHQKAHKLLRPLFSLCVNGRVACGVEAGKWLFEEKPFTVIRNGVYPEKFIPDAAVRQRMRKELGIPENCLVLGHVGMFVVAKNHDFLVALGSAMEQSGKEYRMLLLGEGERMEEIRGRVAEVGLQDKLLFVGSVQNVSDYLQAMDLFVLPSIHEGLPFVLVEAQAAGLHALVSDRVSDEANLTGNLHFLSIDDVNIWVNAIEQYVLPDRQSTAAEACEKLAGKGYDMHRNAAELARLYTDILNKGE